MHSRQAEARDRKKKKKRGLRRAKLLQRPAKASKRARFSGFLRALQGISQRFHTCHHRQSNLLVLTGDTQQAADSTSGRGHDGGRGGRRSRLLKENWKGDDT